MWREDQEVIWETSLLSAQFSGESKIILKIVYFKSFSSKKKERKEIEVRKNMDRFRGSRFIQIIQRPAKQGTLSILFCKAIHNMFNISLMYVF